MRCAFRPRARRDRRCYSKSPLCELFSPKNLVSYTFGQKLGQRTLQKGSETTLLTSPLYCSGFCTRVASQEAKTLNEVGRTLALEEFISSQVKLLSPKQRAKAAASRARTCTNAAVFIASGECPSRFGVHIFVRKRAANSGDFATYEWEAHPL